MTNAFQPADSGAHDLETRHNEAEDDAGLEDSTALVVETSWQQQPIRLPAYTPSQAAKDITRDSPPTTPIDDPIHLSGSKKHFGFSSRQSRASSIFPWQKHKPAVFHQYSPHRPPLSKRSSLAGLKVLPAISPDPVMTMDDQELDLSLKGEPLAKRVLELLHLMQVQDWAEITDHTSLKLDRISGAMTNCIYLVSGPSREGETLPRKVLLRVYGIGLESLFSRENELHWLQNLSTMDIGPSLLGIFKNGRFEQYVESTTLTKEDLRDPRTSRHIAHRLCELHNIVNVFPPPEGTIPQSQANIAKWIPLARAAIGKIIAKDPSKKADLEELDFDRLLAEIDEVHRELLSVHSPLVFAHNDTQYGNILRTKDEDGELVVIDFEYAGYNTRAFDIANHFCEWTADYHSERPSIMHPDRYPTKAEQLNFLEAYMEAEIAMAGYHLTAINMEKYAKTSRRKSITRALTSGLAQVAAAASTVMKPRTSTEFLKEEQAVATVVNGENAENANGQGATKASAAISAEENENDRVVPRKKNNGSDGSGGVTKAEILDSMYKEVNKFALTSHIMWGLWGLHQATQSDIDFDYVEYALQRLNEFRRRRPEFMAL
ncbi:choline kinase [Entomortierella parvispora]|uniref:Choline kinase n=1 Tax=Entomortierella parvispora TaxID=205924 RepID=A0A9P3M2A4_9FUNG|nr:choline kinase [Entomortierella parvispora]